MEQVFAIVYDPMNTVFQLLLGEFRSSNGPVVYNEDSHDDDFNTNMILYINAKEKTGSFVGIEGKERIFVGKKGPRREQREKVFFRTNGIDRDHPWAWKDEKGKVWMTTLDFGRYLTYLVELPRT